MANTVERFSNRVANYVKYRPGYPREVLELTRKEMGISEGAVIADIGSGTGLSAKLFLENGHIVYGVEPNAAMRAAAEEYLSEFSNFKSIDGTAEATTLPDSAVDLIIAAQAFHWFEPAGTRKEFKRIVKDGGYVALIWNERQLDATPFLIDYEKLLLKYGKDYEKVRHENITEDVLEAFFHAPFHRATFHNEQVFGLEGLKGRLLSSSYMPAETDDAYGPMVRELKLLFAKHAENAKIKVFYETNVFYCRL
jgi:SAM-dependent methyltransferase